MAGVAANTDRPRFEATGRTLAMHRSPLTGRVPVPQPMHGSPLDTYPPGRRCVRCSCFLSIYNKADDGLCAPCDGAIPGAGGLVLRIAGVFRRFHVRADWRRAKVALEEREPDYAEMMEQVA